MLGTSGDRLRFCELLKTNAPTPHATNSNNAANAPNVKALFIDLTREIKADPALNPPFGDSCTRSQISGGSFNVLITIGAGAGAGFAAAAAGRTTGARFAGFGCFGGFGCSKQRAASVYVRAVAHIFGDVPERVTTSVCAPFSIRIRTVSV